MSRRRLVAAVAALALTAACGSTVQVQGSAAPVQQGSGLEVPTGSSTGGSTGLGDSTTGTALPGSGGTTGQIGTTGSTGAGSGSSSGSTSGSGGTTSGSAPAQSSTGATAGLGAGPTTGRGFTKTTVLIGVGTADDSNAFADSFGLGGLYQGDPNAWMKAAVDDINKRGGLLGRKVELVKHDYNTAQLLNDPAGANQAACTTWTQDTPVFAVLLGGLIVEDTLLQCLNKASTPLIYPGASLDLPLHYQASYERFPLFFNVAQMVGERYDRLAIARLGARKFFSPWDTRTGKPGTAATPVKVGILSYDDPDGAVQEQSRRKELAKLGLQVESVKCPRALSSNISCHQSAVLRFATNGVTHVFGAALIFMQNADSQNYHPRYFVQTVGAALAENLGPSQLNGAMGEGYVPLYDVELSEYPGDPSPAAGSCKALMKRAGQASTDRGTLALQLSVCEEFNYLEAAVKAAGELGPSALRRGFESLGAAQPSTLTWTSFLGPSEHTSARAVRDLEYRTNIERFAYTSKTNHA